MKILFLTEFFPTRKEGEISGGSESRTYYLSQELEKKGHKVTVVTARLSGSDRDEVWDGVRVVRVGPEYRYIQAGSNLRRLRFLLMAIMASLRLDYDVIDGNNIAVYLAALLAGKIKGKRVVYWVPDVMGLSQWVRALGMVSGVMGFIDEAISLILPADRIIALSETTKEKLVRRLVPPDKIVVVYPGCSLLQGQVKKRRPKTILAIQRLVEYKRTDLVVKAMTCLEKKREGFRCRIIGEGPERARLVTGNVTFLGNLPRQQVMEELGEAAIFCLPSEIEGFGIVTLEAMGAGVPFVNSDIPVHREIAAASGAGILFGRGDALDLARKIRGLLKNRDRYRELRSNAIRFARQHTWRKVALETEMIYENLYAD